MGAGWACTGAPNLCGREVGGMGAGWACTGAPNLFGRGGWGRGCCLGVHWCPEPDWSGRLAACPPRPRPRLEGLGLADDGLVGVGAGRSEEHTSELQSLMRISYAV